MSINEYKQLQAQAESIGIYTACDLSKFYEYEKRAGETLPATLARYAAEILSE